MSSSVKILISDPVDSVCASILKKAGFSVDQLKLTKDELLAQISNYDGLIVRSETKVTEDVLKAGKNLKIVGRAGTGVDNVDLNTSTQRGILVMNTPGGNTLSAAEHTCALISSLARHIPQSCGSLKNGAWDRKLYSGTELYGKTLAILGLGRIGKEVALRMQSFGMKTIGYDPIIPASVSQEFGVESLSLEQIWPLADYITVHTPLIPQTKHLINDAVFAKCKKGVKLINVARGGIIEEESLLRNLKNGNCGGAGLDVFVEEPPKSDYYKELLSHPKIVCTPHLGASTSEAQLRVAEEIGEQFVDFFNGTGLVGAVNAGNLAVAMSSPVFKPWLNLARALGVLSSIFGQSKEINIFINNSGGDMSFLTAGVVSGYLSGISNDASINMINAPSLAQNQGIVTNLTQSKELGPNLLKIQIKTPSQTYNIIGAANGNIPTLLKIDDEEFKGGLQLIGNILFFTSTNKDAGFSPLEESVTKSGGKVSNFSRSCSKYYTATICEAQINPTPAAPFTFIAQRQF